MSAPPAPTTPPKRSGRKGLRVLGGLGAVLVATLAAAEWAGWPFLRDPLAAMVSRQTGRTVSLEGDFRLHTWRGLRVEVERLVVNQPGWLPTPPGASTSMVDASQVSLRLPWSSILHTVGNRRWDTLRFEHLWVERLRMNLLRDPQGRANWRFTPDGREAGEGATADPPREDTAVPYFGEIRLKEGALTVTDAPHKLVLQAMARTDEGMAQRAGAKGLSVQGSGRYQNYPFTLSLRASGLLPLLRRQQPAEQVPISLAAQAGPSRLSFEGTSQDVLTMEALDGKVRVRGRSMAALGEVLGVTLPTTSAFHLEGRLRKNGQRWALNQASLAVGESRLGGDFEVWRRDKQVPVLRGELRGTTLALQDLGPSFGVPVKGADVPAPPPGKVLPTKKLDVPSLRALEADVRVRLKRVTLGRFFQQPLTPLEGDLSLHGGVLSLSQLNAATASGSVTGDIRLDGREPVMGWRVRLRWRDIRLEQWIKAPNRFAKNEKAGYVSGRLAGQTALTGQGNSVAALMASLDGEVLTWIERGRVSRLLTEAIDLHLLEALGLVITGDEFKDLQCGIAKLDARNGVLRPNPVVLDTGASTVLVSGRITLSDERLNLTVVSAPRHMTLFSLRSPIDLGGTFSNPDIGLQGGTIGLKALSALVLGSVTPLAAVIPLIDTGQAAPSCANLLKTMR